MSLMDVLSVFGPGAAGLLALAAVMWLSRRERLASSTEMRYPRAFFWILAICAMLLLAISGAGIHFGDLAMAGLFGACGALSLVAIWGFAQVRHGIGEADLAYRPAFRPPRTLAWAEISGLDYLPGRNAWALTVAGERHLVGGMLTGQAGFARAALAHVPPGAIHAETRARLEALAG